MRRVFKGLGFGELGRAFRVWGLSRIYTDIVRLCRILREYDRILGCTFIYGTAKNCLCL